MDEIIPKTPTQQRGFTRSTRPVLMAVATEPTPPNFTSYTDALRNHSDACAYFGADSPEAASALSVVTACYRT